MIKQNLTVWITNVAEILKGEEPRLYLSSGLYYDMSSEGWFEVNPKHISLKMAGTKIAISAECIEEVKEAGRSLAIKKAEAARKSADEAEAALSVLNGETA